MPDRPLQRELKNDDNSHGKNEPKPDDNKSQFDLNRHMCQRACLGLYGGGNLDVILQCLDKYEVKRARKLESNHDQAYHDASKSVNAAQFPTPPPPPGACNIACFYSSTTSEEIQRCLSGCLSKPNDETKLTSEKATNILENRGESDNDQASLAAVMSAAPTLPDYTCVQRCLPQESSHCEAHKCIINECTGRGNKIADEANALIFEYIPRSLDLSCVEDCNQLKRSHDEVYKCIIE